MTGSFSPVFLKGPRGGSLQPSKIGGGNKKISDLLQEPDGDPFINGRFNSHTLNVWVYLPTFTIKISQM